MNLSERDAKVEIACHLFEVGRLRFHAAMRLAGVERGVFEEALNLRGIAIHRPTVDDLQQDLAALKKMGI